MPSPSSFFARLANADADEGLIQIFQLDADGSEQLIGQYENSYTFFERTFMPFEKDGRWFALYSRDYTATRIMELPSCRDLGGEEGASEGFCPVEYFVPGPELVGAHAGRIGFVYGCYWAHPFEIQFLDLTRADEGVLGRDARFGFIEMPTDIRSLQHILRFHRISDQRLQVSIKCELNHFLEVRPDRVDNWRAE